MDDATAASAGFVLAGVALAASFLGWPGNEVAAGLAAVALVAFGLRRYDRLDRRRSAVVAGVGSTGAVAAGLYATVQGSTLPGPVVVVLAGSGSAVLAYADWLGLGREALAAKGGATVRGMAIGALGIVGIYAYVVLVGALLWGFLPGGIGPSLGAVLSTLASGAGTLTVVVLYLRWSDRDVSFLDLRWPDLPGIGYAVGGTLLILGGNLAIGTAFQRFGVESATHTVIQTAETDPTVLLALIPLSYLVIAPGEELLYRNVVQKSLRETFRPVAGVVVASAIFAAVHLPAYSSPDASSLATLSTLAVVFVLALVLGAIYERTRNVVVSMLAHGTFNAIAFALTYAQLTGQFGG